MMSSDCAKSIHILPFLPSPKPIPIWKNSATTQTGLKGPQTEKYSNYMIIMKGTTEMSTSYLGYNQASPEKCAISLLCLMS